jgi:AmiR/NasT family two-component response regulator
LAIEHAAHLEEALRTARLIGAAMGVVMADRKVTEADAFLILKRASQRANLKLRVLAEDVVRSGDLSGLPQE